MIVHVAWPVGFTWICTVPAELLVSRDGLVKHGAVHLI